MPLKVRLLIGLTSRDGQAEFSYEDVARLWGVSRASNILGHFAYEGCGAEAGGSVEKSVSVETSWASDDARLAAQYCQDLNDFIRRVFLDLQQRAILVDFAAPTVPWGQFLLHHEGRPILKVEDFVSHPLISVSSTFGLKSLVEWAKDHLVIIGQNLYFLTAPDTKDKYKDLLFNFLRIDPQRRVDVMICHPDNLGIIEVWAKVAGQRFGQHLQHSVEMFRRWVGEARQEGLNNLVIKTTCLFPVSMTFVDPRSESGLLVITPVLDDLSSSRPCFILEAKNAQHAHAFSYYYEVFNHVYNNSSRSSPLC